jgi:hypothetical protein
VSGPATRTGALSSSDPRSPATHSRWLTRRAVVATVALAVWVPGCAVAAWWQVGIALGGDGLGWVYSVMWPCFALFGAIFWWFLVHDDPDTLGARGLRRAAAVSLADADSVASTAPDRHPPESAGERLTQAELEDPELAAYNTYLSSLAERENNWRRH